MGGMITEGDVNYLRSMCPELDIAFPTGQQELLLVNHFRGMPIAKAAESAGYKSAHPAREYLRSPSGTALLSLLRDREFTDVRITIDVLTGMFLEAYHQAATSMEKIAATRELGKLHDIYPDHKRPEIHITNNNIGDVTAKDLLRLTDSQLAALVGPEMLMLMDRNGDLIEGVVEEEPSDD